MSQSSTRNPQLPEDLTGSGNLKVALSESTVTIATSISGTPDVTISAGVDVNNFPAVYPINDNGGSITVDGTVSVSGVVDVDINDTNGIALDSTLTDASQKTRITDGFTDVDVTVANALKVDGSAVTQPISATSLPLPAGASTAAKQPALGTSGTASADVITVQGIPGMEPLITDGSATVQPIDIDHAISTSSTLMQNAATADGDGTDMDVEGYTSAILHIDGSGANAVIEFLASLDGVVFTPIMGGLTGQGPAPSIQTSVTGTAYDWNFSVTGYKKLRARVSSYVSGAVTVTGYKSILPIAQFVHAATDFSTIRGNFISSGNGTTNNGTLRVTVSSDSTGKLAAAQSGTWNINDVSGIISLPTGAATEAKQPSLGTAGTASSNVITIQGIAGMTDVKVDGSAVTQPISATALPLPAGAATETTLATRLSESAFQARINTLGQKTMAASTPVVIASDQSSVSVSQGSLWTVQVGGPITCSDGTNTMKVDGTTWRALRTVLRPTDPEALGWYRCTQQIANFTGPGGAGGEIWQFRYGGPNICVIRQVTMQIIHRVNFTVNQELAYNLMFARSYTANGSGGTAANLTGNNQKLRTSYATSGVSDIRIAIGGVLTAGTRTLDAQPIGFGNLRSFGSGGNAPTRVEPRMELFSWEATGHPIILATNEGMVIQNVVAMGAAGIIGIDVEVEWGEFAAF